MEIAPQYILFQAGLLSLEWPTAIVVFLFFLIVMFSMNKLLFKPVLETLEKRKSLTESNLKEVQEKTDEINEIEIRYKKRLETVKQEIQIERKKLLDRALQTSKLLIDKSKQKNSKKIVKIEEELNLEIEQAKKMTKKETKNIADFILSKVSS